MSDGFKATRPLRVEGSCASPHLKSARFSQQSSPMAQ
eukprot:CAMPEP_0181437904 /NCGR_PEP_ID=MMETSP1110-20121109/21626_1 /TAXON_ID=174948 /ORGANISM="Symbiodinium sp., Strain CCMP421" /LENGTH=36 /DNA_ID= /DNA_START= /DNA_END= /DNA_ORIENTATION=